MTLVNMDLFYFPRKRKVDLYLSAAHWRLLPAHSLTSMPHPHFKIHVVFAVIAILIKSLFCFL